MVQKIPGRNRSASQKQQWWLLKEEREKLEIFIPSTACQDALAFAAEGGGALSRDCIELLNRTRSESDSEGEGTTLTVLSSSYSSSARAHFVSRCSQMHLDMLRPISAGTCLQRSNQPPEGHVTESAHSQIPYCTIE